MVLSISPTKLYIPSPRTGVVLRSRLLDRLDAGLQSGCQVTAIVAPAGSGKTTLITSWVYSSTSAAGSRALAWLSLDPEDNDPVRFLNHLIAALRQIEPRAGRGVLSVLGSPRLPPISDLIDRLMSDLAGGVVPGLLILDDVHMLRTPEVQEALGAIVAHMPRQLHLVLASREQLPLALPRMRVRGTLTEIDARDLQFTVDEAQSFLTPTLGASASEEIVAQAVARTEGWAAGLQLLSLAAQREPAQTLARASATLRDQGSDTARRYITDYLLSEVLSRQPEDVQRFLRATSILDKLTGPLCDHVAGREDSHCLLSELASSGLFVLPLDESGRWYRYHTLFAEVLQSTLQRSECAPLHRRALMWYDKAGMGPRAVHHGLVLGRTTGEWDEAVRLLRVYAEAIARRGEIMLVKSWLEAVPEPIRNGDVALMTLQAWILAMTGDLVRADVLVRKGQALLPNGEDAVALPGDQSAGVWLGKLHALRSFVTLLKEKDNLGATRYAESALSLLPPQAAGWRVLALWSCAEAQERLDHLDAAIESLWAAQRLGRSMPETLFAVVAEGGLVKLLNDHGRRRDALALCQDALTYYRDEAGAPMPLAGFIYSQMGVLYYEANELASAHRMHAMALQLGASLGLAYELVYQRALAAPTWFALGEVDRALAALRAGYREATQRGYADADWFLAWEANIRLWDGDFVAARHWAAAAGLSPQAQPRLLRIEQHVAYARFLVAERRYADAREWLGRLETFTLNHGLTRWLTTVRIQRAGVSERLGDRDSALALLQLAVQDAAPEGYVRPFLDEDARIPALVGDLRQVAPSFVDRIRASGAAVAARQASAAQGLVEPLTERELEVLQLVAAGATNREIAERLVIAPGTVKRHTNHIYGKLQVHNRTEAVVRARDLGIL